MYLRRMQLLLLASCVCPTANRLIWEKKRSKLFWEKDCQLFSEAYFKTNFRVSRDTFAYLCGVLKNLEKDDTTMRPAIPLPKRIALALYTLGSSAEYRSIANLFGVGISTVSGILMEFCNEVWDKLWPSQLNDFPLTEEKLDELRQGFEKLGLPQCFGAIDGCHIEVHPKVEEASDYYNYKGLYSTVLLALVDYRYRFIYINVGCPGRCNGSQILID